MKTIILVRHAESQTGFGQPDLSRKLTPKGRVDATSMAEVLLRRGLKPEKWFSSPAVRAMETAEVFRRIVAGDQTIEVVEKLYEPSVTAFYDVLESVSQDVQSIIVFSHNPGISDFINQLECHPEVNMPPGGVFIFESSAWKNFRLEEKRFSHFMCP